MQIETLEMEIKHIKDELDEMKVDVKEIKEMFNKLDDRYPTRREVKVIVSVLWFISTCLWVIAAILWFAK